MRLKDLSRHGIPERIVEIWQQRQGATLLPVQAKAVRKGLLDSHDTDPAQSPPRLLIVAPTSSGKSFCAEMAMVSALIRRRQAVMLVPLKALAEQQYRRLCQTYEPLGIRCLIVTGDHPENDRHFAAGEFDLAVAIYEKFDLTLTANLDALRNIGLIAIDEIQTIAEPGRGAVLERMLTKILASVFQPSLLCLSAVIGDSSRSGGCLSEWLGATLVEETSRPVDLNRGVATDGTWHYRSYNSGLDGSESFEQINLSEQPFEAVIRHIKSAGGATLVFLKSRRDSVEGAFRLAAGVNWPAAATALDRLGGEEPSFLVRSLQQVLSHGVAFHNADLSPRQRQIIEESFEQGEIKVVFATTTLALGVDLPADTVYLETAKYASGAYGTRPSLVPVTRAEFDNMTGRAGRLRAGGGTTGRAFVLALSEFDRDILWENYIAPDQPEPLVSALRSMPPEDWLLDAIVCGLVNDGDTAANLFDRTFCARQDTAEPMPDFAAALSLLERHRLIRSDDGGASFCPTPVGQATARAGLSVAQSLCLLDKLADHHPHTEDGWLALALSAPGWRLPPGMLTRFELADNGPARMLYERYSHLLDDAALLVAGEVRSQRLTYDQAGRLKSLMLLHDWRQLAPLQQLEQEFQLHIGQIMSLSETAAHLLSSLSLLIGTDRGPDVHRDDQAEKLSQLAVSVRHGLPPELSALHERVGTILHRGDLAVLAKADIKTLSDLLSAGREKLDSLITGRTKQQILHEQIDQLRKETDMHTAGTVTNVRPAAPMPTGVVKPESVEIDGTYERERYLIRINGFPVRLTGKSFKYFTRLAWWRANRDTGWIFKEDLEVGFNQARYLYRMKSEVLSAITLPWSIIENNRLGYYRLNIEPSRIRFNLENLRQHPDYEIRTLVEKASA